MMTDNHDQRNTQHGRSSHPHHAHGHDDDGHAHHRHADGKRHAGFVKDPVCGMDVDPHAAKHRASLRDARILLLGRLQSKFELNPGKYVSPVSAKPAEPIPEGTIYTCPMHPQIRQVGRAAARSAAWRSSRSSPPRKQARTLNSPI